MASPPTAKHQFFVEGVEICPILGSTVPVGDAGRLKYDCHLARLRWEVDFWVGLVVQTLTHCLSARLDLGDTPDWSNRRSIESMAACNVKAQAEGFLHAAGVTAALEVAKSRARRAELAVTFLRTVMSSLQGGTTHNYKRRTGLQALAGAEERAAQLDAILIRCPPARLAQSASWTQTILRHTAHPILSDTFSSWFMGLKDGTDIVYAANALGRLDEAMKVIKLRTAKFVESNCRTELSMLQTAAGWHDSVRGTLTISESNFPDLERVLYVHDILHDPASLILGNLAPILADLKLVRVPVNSILRSRRVELESVLGKKHADAILSVPVCDLEVFVGEDALVGPKERQRNYSGWLRVARLTIRPTLSLAAAVCNNCFVDGKKDKTCAGRRFFKAETILDLPPHNSRQIWYQLRIGTHWTTWSGKKKAKD
ncbi:hypothetical protein B0H14DRAFT_2655490 [Mycena olivaceomarginata]|nr:hypothetical protein B0H14DRAFT_2655490 [Mycena olivaceomarginata]